MKTLKKEFKSFGAQLKKKLIEELMTQMIQPCESYEAIEEDDIGSLEADLSRGVTEMARVAMEQAAQIKADKIGAECPKCGAQLRKKEKVKRTIQTCFGVIEIQRIKGWCAKCQQWFYPADMKMNVENGATPRMEELAALFTSKMPVTDAADCMKIACAIPVSRSTLDRLAKKGGKQAGNQLEKLNKATLNPTGASSQKAPVRTLIIEMDAWNIRERDHWGKSDSMRRKGQEPGRWHWVWTGTVFSLDHRLKKQGRAMISERGYVTTRLGTDDFRDQIYAEALRRGYGQAQRVIVLGDGAAWIWNMAQDRFSEACQRLDYYHLKEHLWTVARELYPDQEQAKKWVKEKSRFLRKDKAIPMIESLDVVLESIEDSEKQLKIKKEINYFISHQDRMDYQKAKKLGEPMGSGAIESTCRQLQCRFKRPGQFWSQQGDQALLYIDGFWRNQHWSSLYPHSICSRPDLN